MTHDELPEGYKPTNTVEVIAGAGRKYEQTRPMTHNELLETIDFLPLDGLHAWMQPALRAVVELHKPKETTPPWEYVKYLACSVCENYTNDGAYFLPYPCETIQVIEKELL